MKRWIEDQLGPLTSAPFGIMLDPEGVLPLEQVDGLGEIRVIEDWYGLRRVYEHEVRDAGPDLRLTVVARTERYPTARDLPWDIEQAAEVVRFRIPGPPEYRDLLLDLPDILSDRATEILGPQPTNPLPGLLRLWGVVLPAESHVAEIRAVLRLRLDATFPETLWMGVGSLVHGALAQAMAYQPPRIEFWQEAWDDWLQKGQASRWNREFQELGPEVAPLFHSGMLAPAAMQAEVPGWVRGFGAREADVRDRIEELLSARPDQWPPDAAGWIGVAAWWGEIRALAADINEGEWRSRSWALWEEIDATFVPWLLEQYDGLLFRSGATPLSVDKVAPFLARRLRSGADRILLVVLDGMGFMQWSLLRDRLQVLEASGSFAMVPTLTPVSRQAILAGATPQAFPDTVRDTAAEEKRWPEFWEGEGVDVRGVRYTRVTGSSPQDVPEFGQERVHGVVVTAIDKQLHGVEVLGDSEVAGFVGRWVQAGFLEALVRAGTEAGFEIWLTADHGNLEVTPLGGKREGLAVDAAGLRVRWYRGSAERSTSDIDGITWDPGCLPADVCYPLFARGRGAFFTGELQVTHGGLSLDEVVVPLVQVTT